MKKILGEILFFLLCLSSLYSAEAFLDKDHIIKGESVTLKLSVEGERATFPKITQIGGFDIESVSSSKSEIVKSGKIYRYISKYYTFTPLNDVSIPSFKISVDGKVEKTSPLNVKVKSIPSKDFDLEMYVNKKRAFVGEPILLSIIFRKRIGVSVQDIRFSPPSFVDFWAKELKTSPKEIVGSFVVQKLQYVIFPQKEGKLKISPTFLNIAVPVRSGYSYYAKWKKIVSNSLTIDVKPLANGVNLYGKYSLFVDTDKKEVSSNKPVNLVIKITGEGNIEDISDFSLNIPNVTIYKKKPKILARYEKGDYRGSFIQNFSILSKKSFTIPPFTLSYFDKDKKEVVTLKSNPIKIKVINSKKEQDTKIVKSDIKKEDEVDMKKLILLSLSTFIIGILIGLLIQKERKKKKKALSSIQKRIKAAKSDKELLKVLLPFVERSKEIEEIVLALESNVYEGGGYKIDKKQLIKKIDSYLKGDRKKEEFEELI